MSRQLQRLRPSDASGRPTGLFDPQSRDALLSFAVQLALLTAVCLAFAGRAPLQSLIVLTALSGQVNSLAGFFARQPFGRGPLNRFDVSMMLFAVSLGARFLG